MIKDTFQSLNENNQNTTLPQIQPHEIIQYYDECKVDYKWVWHLSKLNAMHYGFWEEKTPNLRTALKNLNDQVVNRLQLKKGMKILDAGCGVGGTSMHIAIDHDVHVHGITLSEKQVQEAQNKSKRIKNKGQVEFSVRDFINTNFSDEHFDGIFAIESICHANNKIEFLKEAYRILRPGGVLVVSDFFTADHVTDSTHINKLNKWAETWAVPYFEYNSAFINKANEVGFQIEQVDNVTANIFKSAKRLYYYFYPGIVCHHILRLIGYRNRTHEKNVWSTYYQYKTLKEGLWQYNIVKFSKPQNYVK